MKSRLIRFFTKNIGLKIVSYFIAWMIWFLVVRVDDPLVTKTFTQIPVELTNTDVITKQGQVYEIEDGTDTTSITVTAKRSVLDALSRDNFKATADLNRLNDSAVPIDIRAMRYADRIDNISLRRRSDVIIKVEKLLEKQINIKPETIGNLPDGYVVGNIKLDRNVVKISGPESEVSRIEGAEIVINIADMTSDISTEEDIVLKDAIGNGVDMERLTLSQTSVGLVAEIWKTKEVSIAYATSGEPAAGYGMTGAISCTPETLTVAGPDSVLSEISVLSVPASAIDVTGAASDIDVGLDIEKYLPKGLTLLKDEEGANVVVHVGIAALLSRKIEVPVSAITVANVPEGYEAIVGGLGDVVAVEIRGLGQTFDTLDPGLVTGVIDCNNLELPEDADSLSADGYEAEVMFVFPEGVQGGDNAIVAQLLLRRAGEGE